MIDISFFFFFGSFQVYISEKDKMELQMILNFQETQNEAVSEEIFYQ